MICIARSYFSQSCTDGALSQVISADCGLPLLSSPRQLGWVEICPLHPPPSRAHPLAGTAYFARRSLRGLQRNSAKTVAIGAPSHEEKGPQQQRRRQSLPAQTGTLQAHILIMFACLGAASSPQRPVVPGNGLQALAECRCPCSGREHEGDSKPAPEETASSESSAVPSAQDSPQRPHLNSCNS